MKAGSTAMTQRPTDRVPSGSMLALLDPRRPDRANPPTNFWWSPFLIALAWSTCTGFPLDRQSTNLGFKEVQKRFRWKRPALFKWVNGISSRTMHLSTTPSLSQTIWPRLVSRQFLTLPIVKTYIYIYIYIRLLVVTKSVCGYVSIQVQYNMESAQYLG